MFDFYQIAAAAIDALPIYWSATDWAVFALTTAAMIFAAAQSRRTLIDHNASDTMLKFGVPKKKHPASERHIIPAMPLMLLEFGHRLLRALLILLSILFAVSFVTSWYVVSFHLEDLVGSVYALNGKEQFFLLPVKQSIAELGAQFRPVAFLQVLTIAPLVATVIARLFGKTMTERVEGLWRKGWVQLGHSALLIATIVFGYLVVWPLVQSLIDTILFASASSANWGSILSQAVLSPLYAQAVFSFAGLAYLVLYAVLVLLFAVNRLLRALPLKDALAQLYDRSKRLRIGLIELCGGASLSFAVTIGAVMIGRATAASATGTDLPVTPGLLLWNAFFDALTLTVTAALLGLARRLTQSDLRLRQYAEWVIADKVRRHGPKEARESLKQLPVFINMLGVIPIILAVFVLDILAAAILSVLAIWFGLGSGDWAVDLREAFRMLFGLSEDGTGFSFSSEFWVMHTTFIPSVIYVTIIAYSMLFTLVWLLLGNVLRSIAKAGFLVTILLSIAAVGAKQVVEFALVPPIERFISSGHYARTVNATAMVLPQLISPTAPRKEAANESEPKR